MDLIYYRGLNCRLACIMSIVNTFGINYRDSYAALWSETDFVDDVKYDIYSSKRIYTDLEAIGIDIEEQKLDELKSGALASRIQTGELILVGLDTFYIPWHPVYKHFHDLHFLYAEKQASGSLLCFDPVYAEKNAVLDFSDISPAFELCRIHKREVNPPKISVTDEAAAILRGHPEVKRSLLDEILAYKNSKENQLTITIKKVIAMLNNRYLYRYFFHQEVVPERCTGFFDKDYFSKWEAIKNGLYKMQILKNNLQIIGEVTALLDSVLNEEMDMAKAILDFWD